jgi:hypothetical protein
LKADPTGLLVLSDKYDIEERKNVCEKSHAVGDENCLKLLKLKLAAITMVLSSSLLHCATSRGHDARIIETQT